MNKTNAMRQLDRAKIKYEVLEYDIPYEEFSGIRVAQVLNMDMDMLLQLLGFTS